MVETMDDLKQAFKENARYEHRLLEKVCDVEIIQITIGTGVTQEELESLKRELKRLCDRVEQKVKP